MRKRKSSKKFAKEPLYTEVKETVADLLIKLGIKENMSMSAMVQTVRGYIDSTSNPIRTCNAIMLKLGLSVQFKTEARKSRVYALTAIEQALLQGSNFDPATVASIAEQRLVKIENMIGRDVESVNIKDEDEKVKIKSKAEIAREIFAQMITKEPAEIVSAISNKLKLEKQQAYSYYYSAKRSLTV